MLKKTYIFLAILVLSTGYICSETIGNTHNGYGIKTYDNGDEYIGRWYSNKHHGRGIYTYSNGKVQQGIFYRGSFIGSKSDSRPVAIKAVDEFIREVNYQEQTCYSLDNMDHKSEFNYHINQSSSDPFSIKWTRKHYFESTKNGEYSTTNYIKEASSYFPINSLRGIYKLAYGKSSGEYSTTDLYSSSDLSTRSGRDIHVLRIRCTNDDYSVKMTTQYQDSDLDNTYKDVETNYDSLRILNSNKNGLIDIIELLNSAIQRVNEYEHTKLFNSHIIDRKTLTNYVNKEVAIAKRKTDLENSKEISTIKIVNNLENPIGIFVHNNSSNFNFKDVAHKDENTYIHPGVEKSFLLEPGRDKSITFYGDGTFDLLIIGENTDSFIVGDADITSVVKREDVSKFKSELTKTNQQIFVANSYHINKGDFYTNLNRDSGNFKNTSFTFNNNTDLKLILLSDVKVLGVVTDGKTIALNRILTRGLYSRMSISAINTEKKLYILTDFDDEFTPVEESEKKSISKLKEKGLFFDVIFAYPIYKNNNNELITRNIDLDLVESGNSVKLKFK